MTRAFAFLFAALIMLAGAGQAQAQFFFGRLARHHGRRPRFLPTRHAQRIEPDPAHHREL